IVELPVPPLRAASARRRVGRRGVGVGILTLAQRFLADTARRVLDDDIVVAQRLAADLVLRRAARRLRGLAGNRRVGHRQRSDASGPPSASRSTGALPESTSS